MSRFHRYTLRKGSSVVLKELKERALVVEVLRAGKLKIRILKTGLLMKVMRSDLIAIDGHLSRQLNQYCDHGYRKEEFCFNCELLPWYTK